MPNFQNARSFSAGGAPSAARRPLSEVQPIRVLIADEPSVFRDGLRALLTAQPDLHVVGEVADLEAVHAVAQQLSPDIILLEPDRSGRALMVLRALNQSSLPVRIILLTASEDSELLSHAVRYGVAGIVAKKSPTELLLKSIRKVNAGELWLERTTAASVVRELIARPIPLPRHIPVGDRPVDLSRRERDVVTLVTQGFRNREIAETLFISEQTVKNHMHNIFEKVGVHDRLELALYAIYHRLYR